jgi:hypothetical protein
VADPQREIVEAREAFAVTLPNGTPLTVGQGDRFYADDPIVKGREKLFGELKVRSSVPPRPTTQDSETASAGPGSRRAVSRPPAGVKSDA